MKNIINSTWDTLDLPTKASIMRESLLKGITDIDVIRKNYDSKYLNVNMLPEVEDNFSRELLYDLYNKVEGNNRSNNMYPSNSYGNLFVDGGYTDDTPLIFEDVFYTDLGSIPTVRGKSNMPSSIQLTKELIKELKKKSHYQSFDYSHLSPDRRPMLNPTTFILVPIGYGLDGYQLNNNSGESVTYYIDDSLPPDENGNYILSKLDLDSPIGKTYSDWKMTQEAFKLRMSNPNMYNLSSEDAVTQIYDDNSIKNPEEDYIPLDEVEVLGTSKKGEGDKKEATTSISTLTSGNGTLELGIPNPYNFKGDEIKVTLGDGSRGVPGAGLFGDKTGTDLIREYNSNGNPVYYYPRYSNGSNGYYYPNPITIKWPDNYNLPDYSSEYDATHDGVPVELLPFIEDDKLNLRDLLAWILTLMNNRSYPLGEDSEFLLPKRSKLINPLSVTPLIEESHIFKNKKSKGGSLNKFDDGGYTYIPEKYLRDVINPFEFEGIRYGWLPNSGIGEDIYKEHNDRNGVYVRWDNDANKWAKTTVSRDLGNIKNYFANKHNGLTTYDISKQIIDSQIKLSKPYQRMLAHQSDLITSDRTDLMPYIRDMVRYINDVGYAPADYFMDTKHKQKEHFIKDGWIEGDFKDYGLVQKQAETFNKNAHTTLPVYKKNKDYINKNNLTPIGQINNVAGLFTVQKDWRDAWLGDPDLGLGSYNAGNFPTQIYIDKDNNLYLEAWDLNDYGNLANSGGLTSLISTITNLYDRIGNPTVVTTGIQPIITPIGKNANISDTTDMYPDKYTPLKKIIRTYYNKNKYK